MPTVAVTAPKIRLFFRQSSVSWREKISVHWPKVKLPGSVRLLPTSTLKEVVRMVAKGIRITTTAKRLTSTVSGMRHLRKSTMFGRVDLPLTVIYWRFAITKSDTYSTITAITIRNTARPVASLRPWVPRP